MKNFIIFMCILLFSLLSYLYGGITVVSSSIESDEYAAYKVIDGDINTRWSSEFNDTEWLELNLGKEYEIDNIQIYWETAYSKEYKVFISKDKSKWKEVYSTTNSDGGYDEINFSKQFAKYIKIDCIKRGTEYGHSIYEIAINGFTDNSHSKLSDHYNVLFSKDIWKIMTNVNKGNALSMEEIAQVLFLNYKIAAPGQCVQIYKDVNISPSDIKNIILQYKKENNKNILKINLRDRDGSNFTIKLDKKTITEDFIENKFSVNDFKYDSGGDNKLDQIKKIFVVIDGKGEGQIIIKKFDLISNSTNNRLFKSQFVSLGSLNLDRKSEWSFINDGQSSVFISEDKGLFSQAIKMDYTLKTKNHGWAGIERHFNTQPDSNRPLTFILNGKGFAELEIKFIDNDGSVFWKKIKLNDYKTWTQFIIYKETVEYQWGGRDEKFSGLSTLQLIISGQGKGTVWLDEIGFGQKDLRASFPPAPPSGPQLDPDRELKGIGFKQRRDAGLIPEDPLILEWLKLIQDTSSSARQVLPSAEDNQLQSFNNSLVAMAFILKEERERAERILDFYSAATKVDNSDPTLQNFFYKGEPRGFFQHVNLNDKPGIKALRHNGNADRWMGDMCWMLIAYKYYEKKYQSKRYEKIIRLLSDLLLSWYKEVDHGNSGYVQHGWRRGDKQLHEDNGHPEGNIDAYAVFKLIGENEKANKIKNWIDKTVGDSKSHWLDLYTWRVLAFGKDYAYLLDIPDYDLRYRKTLVVNGKKVMGVFCRPDITVNNIWFDGVGHIACAYFTVGNQERGNFYANQLDPFIIERKINNKITHAIPYTANKEGDFDGISFDRGTVSIAAWYIFAKNRFNPMTMDHY